MSKSTLAGYQSTGTTDAQPDTDDRSLVIDAATTNLTLESFATFRITSELTEDTIRRLAP